MVEPRRRCFTLPPVDLMKKVTGAIIYVTVVSASKLSKSNLRGRQQSLTMDDRSEDFHDNKDLLTFVEVELEDLTRKTYVRPGSCPKWDSTFNMILHEDTGILRFHLYECPQGSVKYDYLTSCEIKVLLCMNIAVVSHINDK